MYQLGDGKDYLDPITTPVVVSPSNVNKSAVLEVCGGSQHSIALVFNGEYSEEHYKNSAMTFSHVRPRSVNFGELVYRFIKDYVMRYLASRRKAEAVKEIVEILPPRSKRQRNEGLGDGIRVTKRGRICGKLLSEENEAKELVVALDGVEAGPVTETQVEEKKEMREQPTQGVSHQSQRKPVGQRNSSKAGRKKSKDITVIIESGNSEEEGSVKRQAAPKRASKTRTLVEVVPGPIRITPSQEVKPSQSVKDQTSGSRPRRSARQVVESSVTKSERSKPKEKQAREKVTSKDYSDIEVAAPAPRKRSTSSKEKSAAKPKANKNKRDHGGSSPSISSELEKTKSARARSRPALPPSKETSETKRGISTRSKAKKVQQLTTIDIEHASVEAIPSAKKRGTRSASKSTVTTTKSKPPNKPNSILKKTGREQDHDRCGRSKSGPRDSSSLPIRSTRITRSRDK